MTLVFASPRSCLKILATHVYRESNKHKIFLSFRRKFHRFSSVSLLFKATEECSKLHNTTSSSSSCCFCLPCVSWLPQVSSYQHQKHKLNDCSVVAVFDVGSEGKQWVKLFEKLFMLWLSDSQSHKEIIYTHSITLFCSKIWLVLVPLNMRFLSHWEETVIVFEWCNPTHNAYRISIDSEQSVCIILVGTHESIGIHGILIRALSTLERSNIHDTLLFFSPVSEDFCFEKLTE